METLKFKTNINCAGCVGAVTPFMAQEEGIVKWKVDTENPEKILTVETKNIEANQIVAVLEKAGFKAEILD